MQAPTQYHVTLSFFAFAAALACATAGRGQHGVPPGMKPRGEVHLSGTVVIPMEYIGNRMVVSAKLNGKGPYKFILDSGAEVSLLADSFATELGMPSVGEIPVGSPGSRTTKTAAITPVTKIELGGLSVENFTMLAMDLKELQQRVPGLVGVISGQLSDGVLVTYDYPRQIIEFRHGELAAADGQSIFEWPRGQRKPSVPMDIGGVVVRVDLDTGSQGTFTLAKPNVTRLTWLEQPVEGNAIRLVDTEYKAYKGKMKGTIRFGKYSYEDQTVAFHEGPFNNVGYAVLKDFVFTIDPANRRFELRKPQADG